MKGVVEKYYYMSVLHNNFLDIKPTAGVSEWSKEAGLGPAAVGLRGFEPHPPHQHVKT